MRKTQKSAGFTYSIDDLDKAHEDIKSGRKTTRGASMFYNIPRSTFKHRIKGTRVSGLTSREGMGGESSLTCLRLKKKKLWIAWQSWEKIDLGCPERRYLTWFQLYIIQNNIQTRFKDQRPGADCFISFRTRHRLSSKKAQSV